MFARPHIHTYNININQFSRNHSRLLATLKKDNFKERTKNPNKGDKIMLWSYGNISLDYPQPFYDGGNWIGYCPLHFFFFIFIFNFVYCWVHLNHKTSKNHSSWTSISFVLQQFPFSPCFICWAKVSNIFLEYLFFLHL